MITRIEIDGFKSFQDFSVDLAPFQVIIGPNGCGKSNLFDAISLLANLASRDLNTALTDLRGEAFTIKPEGQLASRMMLKVELLVDPIVTDEWGKSVELKHRRLRYVVQLDRRKGELRIVQPYIFGEYLEPITPESDVWTQRFASLDYQMQDDPIEQLPGFYINTSTDQSGANSTIFLMPETDRQSDKPTERFVSGNIERTLLSRVDTCEFPHALAVRQEMQRWQTLNMDRAAVQARSVLFHNEPGMIGGNYLPFQFYRLKQEEPSRLRSISRDLHHLAPGVDRVDAEYNDFRSEYEAFVWMQDGRRFSLPSLSDGTLRLLALVALRYNSRWHGLFCIEEPEIGLHPGVFEKLIRVLRGTATDFADHDQSGSPLRQVLATTHSPALVSHLDLRKGELLYAEMATWVIPRAMSYQVTRMMPVRPEVDERSPEDAYSLNRVLEYLNGASVQTARDDVRKAILRR